jgi:hypothetical protein
MKKYTAGDLETAIQQVWQTSDDLELFFRYHGDVPIPMTEDEIANALLGLKALHDMRIWHLQDMHCRVFELNQYCTDPEKLAVRDDMLGDVEAYLNKKKKGSKK